MQAEGSGVSTTGIGLAAISALAPMADLTGASFLTTIISPRIDPSRSGTMTIRCAPASQFADVIVVQTNDHTIRPGTFSQGISRCPAGYYGFGGGGFYRGSTGFMG